MNNKNDSIPEDRSVMKGRRSFLMASGVGVISSLLPPVSAWAQTQVTPSSLPHSVQSEYSMLWRGPEQTVIPTCEELGIGFVPWSPLGVQFLTGWIDPTTRFAPGDFRATVPRFSPENLQHNRALVELLKKWAERKDAAPAQIALAWLMAQKPWIVPIPGTTHMVHMRQNTNATTVQFTATEIKELNESVAAIEIHGQRLPDTVLAFSNVETPIKK